MMHRLMTQRKASLPMMLLRLSMMHQLMMPRKVLPQMQSLKKLISSKNLMTQRKVLLPMMSSRLLMRLLTLRKVSQLMMS